MKKNEMNITFSSVSQNESFARTVIAAFCLPLSPSLEEISDIKTAVSEAVTNVVVHSGAPTVKMKATLTGNDLCVEISDTGVGIPDIEKAREPFFSTKPEDERSGMGFTVMESFMDSVEVLENHPHGVVVRMKKKLGEVTEHALLRRYN